MWCMATIVVVVVGRFVGCYYFFQLRCGRCRVICVWVFFERQDVSLVGDVNINEFPLGSQLQRRHVPTSNGFYILEVSEWLWHGLKLCWWVFVLFGNIIIFQLLVSRSFGVGVAHGADAIANPTGTH